MFVGVDGGWDLVLMRSLLGGGEGEQGAKEDGCEMAFHLCVDITLYRDYALALMNEKFSF